MKITDEDIAIRIVAINDLLDERMVQCRKEHGYHTYYLIEELTRDGSIIGAPLFTGNKHDVYLFVCGMYHGLCQTKRNRA